MQKDDLSVKQRIGAAVAVGGESEVTPSGSPVLTGESNLCWAPLRADSLLGLSRKKENEQLELFSCCLSDAKGHVCSFPYGNYIDWLVVLTCLGHVWFLCVLNSSWSLGSMGGGMKCRKTYSPLSQQLQWNVPEQYVHHMDQRSIMTRRSVNGGSGHQTITGHHMRFTHPPPLSLILLMRMFLGRNLEGFIQFRALKLLIRKTMTGKIKSVTDRRNTAATTWNWKECAKILISVLQITQKMSI